MEEKRIFAMLEYLFGNKNIEKILLFIVINEKCYATQLHNLFDMPLTPIQQALAKLEKGGLLRSYLGGKTRFYGFNPDYPILKELEDFLKKTYSLLSAHDKEKYYDPKYRHSWNIPKKTGSFITENIVSGIWSRLSQVRLISFRAQSKSTEKSGWNGIGKGSVDIKKINERELLFHERGSWQTQSEDSLDFSNTFRWTLDEAHQFIALEHLRFGPNKPIFLFNLIPIDQQLLESINSHVCDKDTYFGKICCDDHFIKLNWRVIGPKKNEHIDYIYT